MKNEDSINKDVEYYCSNCGEPVDASDTECKHCGADLVDTIEETAHHNDDEIVLLRTYINEFLAELAKAKLDDAGIDCYLSRDDAGAVDPNLLFTQGIRLLVFRKDAELAAEILKDEE
jgi:hypothetical protein